MPLLTIVRLVLSLLSLVVLGVAGYLLWSYWQGDRTEFADGRIVVIRETWRLWTALGLLFWSACGRLLLAPLLARGPTSSRFYRRSNGALVDGADGARIYVETHGPASGPTLILTHGQGLDSTIWSGLRDALATRFRVFAWDLPGLGKSNTPKGLSLEHAARNLECLIERAGSGRVVLVGHSLGGMIIQELASAEPRFFADRVSGVVLLNTTYVNPLNTMILSKLARALQKPVLEPLSHLTIWITPLAWLSNWQSYWSGMAHLANRLQFSSGVTGSQLEHTALLSTRNSPGAIEQANLSMFHWRGLKAGTIKCPVLIVGGKADIVTKPGASKRISELLPDAELKLVPNANHMGFLQQSADYAALIGDFAATLEQPARVPA